MVSGGGGGGALELLKLPIDSLSSPHALWWLGTVPPGARRGPPAALLPSHGGPDEGRVRRRGPALCGPLLLPRRHEARGYQSPQQFSPGLVLTLPHIKYTRIPKLSEWVGAL